MNNYLREGNLVRLNKDIPNKPTMMVYRVVKEEMEEGFSTSPFKQLIGIECIWFTKDMHIQSSIFNFKDLEIIDQEDDSYE